MFLIFDRNWGSMVHQESRSKLQGEWNCLHGHKTSTSPPSPPLHPSQTQTQTHRETHTHTHTNTHTKAVKNQWHTCRDVPGNRWGKGNPRVTQRHNTQVTILFTTLNRSQPPWPPYFGKTCDVSQHAWSVRDCAACLRNALHWLAAFAWEFP